jgi:hypothetical protein
VAQNEFGYTKKDEKDEENEQPIIENQTRIEDKLYQYE